MKLLTINCQKGWIDSHRESLIDFLRLEIKQEKRDFIFLQEANDRTLELIKEISRESAYNLLTEINPLILDRLMQVAVLHRNDHTLIRSYSLSFANKDRRLVRPEFGVLAGVFLNQKREKVIAASFHFHASFHVSLRKIEALEIKQFLLKLRERYGKETLVLVGGDANSGLPWEPRMLAEIFAPEFVNLTTFKDHTVSSDRLEPSVRLNKLALRLAKVGVVIKLKTDHIFGNKEILNDFSFQSRTLDVIVSDHYPVEVSLKIKQ
jgi:endonuclease/exonuclease/phosphatase family metal-dependent hydrolase